MAAATSNTTGWLLARGTRVGVLRTNDERLHGVGRPPDARLFI